MEYGPSAGLGPKELAHWLAMFYRTLFEHGVPPETAEALVLKIVEGMNED